MCDIDLPDWMILVGKCWDSHSSTFQHHGSHMIWSKAWKSAGKKDGVKDRREKRWTFLVDIHGFSCGKAKLNVPNS